MPSTRALAQLIVSALHRAQRRKLTAAGDKYSTPASSAFESFLLAEYTNIAQAHFNTVDSLANFVKHYLLIASAPIYIVVLFADLRDINKTVVFDFLNTAPHVPAAVAIVFWLIGMCVLGYIVNIRCDTLLYARTVNGIRNYFYNKSDISLARDLQIRTLPTSIHIPEYREPSYFFFVVLMFGFIATAYLAAGLYFLWRNEPQLPLAFGVLVGASLLAHVGLYGVLTRHREMSYLRGNIVGIDIDGVLSNHRQHFCELLRKLTGKALEAESITRIPVHEIPGTQVTRADEELIFNWPSYWHNMPIIDSDVGNVIRKLQNVLGYKIWIITHRGWPDAHSIPTAHLQRYWREWATHSRLSATVLRRVDAVERALGRWIPSFLRGRLIYGITRRWLKKHGIQYDKLVIERGNTNTLDPLFHTYNRFLIARDRKMRVFVEDDLLKARKLANICEVVFLVNHPYNQCDPSSLPSNIIRVTSWHEIYGTLRELF